MSLMHSKEHQVWPCNTSLMAATAAGAGPMNLTVAQVGIAPERRSREERKGERRVQAIWGGLEDFK